MTRTSLAVAALALAACDPAYRVHASVKTAAPCGAPSDSAGAPIPDANVALVCPSSTTPLGKTDSAGHLWVTRAGRIGRECAVTIEKEGMAVRRYPVANLCNSRDSVMTCGGVTVTADLSPGRDRNGN